MFDDSTDTEGDIAFIITQNFQLTFPDANGGDYGCADGDHLYFIWRTPENAE